MYFLSIVAIANRPISVERARISIEQACNHSGERVEIRLSDQVRFEAANLNARSCLMQAGTVHQARSPALIRLALAVPPVIPTYLAEALVAQPNLGDALLRWDRGTRRQAIVQSLLSEVFQGKIRAGTHLVTQDLAERFQVSHTPIREALIALAGIGIVDLLPNRGAVVRNVSAQDVREVCQVRRALECEATRSACGRIDLTRLHELADELKRLMSVKPKSRLKFVEQARAVDSRLHDLIAESCGNDFLAKELSRLKMLFRAFRDVAWEKDEARSDSHRLAEEAREHLAIVDALLAGNAKDAAKAMARHIVSGARYWSRALPPHSNGNGEPTSAKTTRQNATDNSGSAALAAAALPAAPESLTPLTTGDIG